MYEHVNDNSDYDTLARLRDPNEAWKLGSDEVNFVNCTRQMIAKDTQVCWQRLARLWYATRDACDGLIFLLWEKRCVGC